MEQVSHESDERRHHRHRRHSRLRRLRRKLGPGRLRQIAIVIMSLIIIAILVYLFIDRSVQVPAPPVE
jgi:hypothetical protein